MLLAVAGQAGSVSAANDHIKTTWPASGSSRLQLRAQPRPRDRKGLREPVHGTYRYIVFGPTLDVLIARPAGAAGTILGFGVPHLGSLPRSCYGVVQCQTEHRRVECDDPPYGV